MQQVDGEMGTGGTDDRGRQEEGEVHDRGLDLCAEKEGRDDDRPSKRRRLLGGEVRLVRREGELVREVLGDREFQRPDEHAGFTEEVELRDDDISLECDSSDVDITDEEEDHERSVGGNSDGWGVALRQSPLRGLTDAQWHAYWREQGWFIDINRPFPIPLRQGGA